MTFYTSKNVKLDWTKLPIIYETSSNLSNFNNKMLLTHWCIINKNVIM